MNFIIRGNRRLAFSYDFRIPWAADGDDFALFYLVKPTAPGQPGKERIFRLPLSDPNFLNLRRALFLFYTSAGVTAPSYFIIRGKSSTAQWGRPFCWLSPPGQLNKGSSWGLSDSCET